jgi:hypothetical protein
MPDYKCDWILNVGRQGFKETWYLNSNTPQAALAVCVAVTPARIGLLSQFSSIDMVKVSDELILGDSLFTVQFTTTVDPTAGKLTRDIVGSSLLGRVRSVQSPGPGGGFVQYQRQLFLSGLPDDWITYDKKSGAPIISDNAAFLAAFQAWAAKMAGNGFALKVLDKTATSAAVIGVSVNPTVPPGQTTGNILIYSPNHNIPAVYPPGQTNAGSPTSFRIKGAKFTVAAMNNKRGKGLVNGVWQYRNITQPPPPAVGYATTDYLELALPAPAGVTATGYYAGGQISLRKFTYVKIDPGQPGAVPPLPPGISYERFAIRKRGRAYFTPRGRRPVKVS